MATELETLAANLATVSADLKIIVPIVTTLKTQVTDLTAQLAAAQAAGFDVPDDLMAQSQAVVDEANAAVASLQSTDGPASVEIGGDTSGNP